MGILHSRNFAVITSNLRLFVTCFKRYNLVSDSMQTLCKNHFLQQLYRKIDGAVLFSQNEKKIDCVITFQTHSILQRFMLRFDGLQLDCNDHLYIYDGAHAVGAYKVSQSKKKKLSKAFKFLSKCLLVPYITTIGIDQKLLIIACFEGFNQLLQQFQEGNQLLIM